MASQISESDTDTNDKKSDGREVKGKTPGQESMVSVGSTRTILITVPVIEVPTSQRHNTQLRITIIFNWIRSQIMIHCNEYLSQNGKRSS
jgi:hypothetical protein